MTPRAENNLRMRNRLLTFAVAASIVVMGLPFLPTPVAAQEPSAGGVMAGYGEADATWHVGAGAGQYTNKGADNVINSVQDGEVDPHGHSITQTDSYGVHSRLSYRTIVVQDGQGDQVAFVKSDSYLAQDYLSRRVGQILEANDSEISYEEIFHMASHNHSSPYYMTPSPGPWVFQDAFDIRAFEYHARQMAISILEAEDAMVPARMGATTVEHTLFKGMIQRKGDADDGTPKGYPDDFGDLGLSVIRFDDISNAADPKPLATLINWGQHPEGLDNHDLITGDFVASLERFVERETGAPLVFGQGDVGSAEAGPGRPQEVAKLGIPARWSHAGHAQAERGSYLLSRDVIDGWRQIASGSPLVPFSSDFDVAAGNAFVAGPYSHPYPAVSACRTETTIEGNPGAGGAADCTRPHDAVDDEDDAFWEEAEDNGSPIKDETDNQAQQQVEDVALYDKLKQAGVPIPDNYDVPSYFALEENTRLHLQAFKLGDVIIASCACESQVDLILNFESRANEVQNDIWDGFDWTAPNRLPQTGEVLPARMNCTQASPPDGDWTCQPNPNDPNPRAVLDPFTATDYEYRRMKAQIHNDAAGWDLPENVVPALSEPYDTDKIFGNFTKTELSPDTGYKLAIGVGHGGDYNGYTISYREYQSWDDYRKSLTSYGPHTADYMVTRMVQLAEKLNGVPQAELELDIMRGIPDEVRQLAMSRALGATSLATYEAWQNSLPVDGGVVGEVITEPSAEPIERFSAATFSWRGGSNAVDNPVVAVERRVDGEWVPFADQSGEIQTKLDFPNGANAFADTYTGSHDWVWTANFEAFNALPAGIGSTPEGTYRFVVQGRTTAAEVEQECDEGESEVQLVEDTRDYRCYRAESAPFEVVAWDGINVGDLRVEDDGSVSFDVDPIEYPKSYESVFPYIKTSGKTAQGDDVIKTDELQKPFCTTCTFRPWAFGSKVASATVTVERADGTTEQVPATRGEDGRWHADAQLYEGDRAYVAEGGVVDEYGEANAAPSGTGEGRNPRPTETPTPTPTEEAPAPTTVTFTDGSDDGAQYSDDATVAALVADEDAQPVSGADVTFELVGADGTTSWTSTTNSDGVASVTFTADRVPGSYTLTARYDGDATHLGSADMSSFAIDREDTVLTLAIVGKSSSKSLEARLTDQDSGAGIENRTVAFRADGTELGTAKTNNNGVASFELPAKYRGGHHDYAARFDGDDYYLASSAQQSS